MASGKLTLTFYGGTGAVTGSNFLLDDGETKLLIDCGLQQGTKFVEDYNRQSFPYNPRDIAALVVTHTHLDHIGRIPKLVRQGFRGPIFSTPPTKALAAILLRDALSVMEHNHKLHGEPPIYEAEDIERALSLWRGVPYHAMEKIAGDFSIYLKNSGHILGSAIVQVYHRGISVAFTGDLGNSPSPLLPDCEEVTDVDYLVMESVYGDRNHEKRDERRDALEDIIEDTAHRGGTLLIPAFSLERSQILLYEINRLMEGSKIPLLPVFLDSPLAIKATVVYEQFCDYLKSDVRGQFKKCEEIFSFPQLFLARERKDAQRVLEGRGPRIIIAGSGMSMGGRAPELEKKILPDPDSTLLLAGFQVPGTIGRRILDGAKEVVINGETVSVRARVLSIRGYSAHKDSDALVAFGQRAADAAKKIFVTMGEPKASLFLAQRLRDYVGVNTVVPKAGDRVELI